LPDAQLVFDPNRPSGETRLNRAAFDFIIANELYTIEGQEAFHANAVTIDFPPEAREIKSAWRVLTENEIAGGAKERGHYFRLGNH
jgi:hypothetical protein